MGIDWTSPRSISAQSKAIGELDVILFGMMLWEVLLTSWFDLEIITRKRTFKWPYLVYALAKWTTFAFTIGVLVLDVNRFAGVIHAPVNCQALSYFANITSQLGIGAASSLFMLRTIALWRRDLRVVIPLLILHAVQWAVYLRNAFITRAIWGDLGGGVYGCLLITVKYYWVEVQFIYAMIFDLIALSLATWALLRHAGSTRTDLWKLLFLDGLFYFVVAFIFYLACTIVAFMKTSVLLTYMFADIATVAVTIAACRSFVRIGTTHRGIEDAETEQHASTGFQFTWRRNGNEATTTRQAEEPQDPVPGWDDNPLPSPEALPGPSEQRKGKERAHPTLEEPP